MAGTKCSKKKNHKKFSVTSKNGNTRSRCLPKKCTQSKFEQFHFKRPVDGHCRPMDESMPLKLLPKYLKFKANRKRKADKKRRSAKND